MGSGSFPLAWCLWDSPMLYFVSEIHSFYSWITFHCRLMCVYVYHNCLSVHSSMDMWVVSTFWLLWIMLLLNISVTVWVLASVLLGIYLEVKLLDSVSFYFIYFGALSIGAYMFIICYIFLMDWPFYYYKMSHFISSNIFLFCFKVCFSNIRIIIPAFLWFLLQNISFSNCLLSLCLYLLI